MMKIRILFLLFFFVFELAAGGVPKRKQSWEQGTLFGYWGYNRSVYTKSNIRFKGYGYDFVMNGVQAKDRPSTQLREYVNINTITVPQFNARIGYYYKDHWSISFGYDHLKYVMRDGQDVTISGNVDPGIDSVTNLSGSMDNFPMKTNESTFHYENSNGLNYLRFELMRTDQWYSTRQKNFAFSTLMGIGTGGLLNFNDFTFAGQKDMVNISLSGYAISGHLSARFEFFKHFFIQGNASAGFMHQLGVKTRANDPSARAKHKYGFAEVDAVVGFFLFIRPTNSCNSCPHW